MLNYREKTYSVDDDLNLYLIPFNRPVVDRRVNVMIQSIMLMGIVRRIIIAKVKFIDNHVRAWIVDGQHLHAGIMKMAENRENIKRYHLRQPLTYIFPQTKTELIAMMAMLNSTSNPWVLGDYVNAWAAISSKNDYQRLLELHTEYGYTYSTLCMVMASNAPGHAVERMKKGKFKISDEDFGMQVLHNLDEAFKVFPRGMHSEQKVFVQAYLTFFKEFKRGYRHERFLDAITKHNVILTRSLHSVGECRAVLSELYHGRIQNASRVILEHSRGTNKRTMIVHNTTAEGGRRIISP